MEQPTGLARRRVRISDEETQRRMLDTALDLVHHSGLTVSLDHLSLEDVIRSAGVSRSAVYRRWPYKDLFVSDLLREIARATTPTAIAARDTATDHVRRIAAEHVDWLRTAELRLRLAETMLAEGARLDFATIRDSTEWRTYLALHATYLSLESGELRDEVGESLARSERAFVERIAAAFTELGGLVGYRPREGMTFHALAVVAQATMRGMVTMSMATPSVGELVGPGVAGAVLAHLEPDPSVTWDSARYDRIAAHLTP